MPPPTARQFDIDAETRVLAHCHWQPEPKAHPTLLALHGLEGSSDAHYMRGIADKAFRRGFNVVRLNQRNCGGTEHLSAGLYHSGLTSDVEAVLDELATADDFPSLVVPGYSLGGNLALRLAGGYGETAPRWLHAVCAVSPTLELGACMDLLERPANRLYEWNIMQSLQRRGFVPYQPCKLWDHHKGHRQNGVVQAGTEGRSQSHAAAAPTASTTSAAIARFTRPTARPAARRP